MEVIQLRKISASRKCAYSLRCLTFKVTNTNLIYSNRLVNIKNLAGGVRLVIE